MGEIRATARLENYADILNSPVGRRRRKARSIEIDAVVDTGAVMMLLPQEAVEALGLKTLDNVTALLANDQKIELGRAGPIRITVAGRWMSTDCLVGPPGCEALIGQIIMEGLDLIADPGKRTLTPRPESPFRPTLKLKVAA